MDQTLPLHGGDLEAAARRWGVPASGWLDLSTGINPQPWPMPPLDAAVWARLPGAEADRRLRRAAAERYGAASEDEVLAAPGTQALIGLLPRLFPPSRVAILGPTYAEHQAAWAASGHEVAVIGDLAGAEGADVVVVVNPNNPDGRAIEPAPLTVLAEALGRRGGSLVVDEAFADCTPEISLASRLVPNLLVLRSFGKFYGLAGVRLGFALGLPATLEPVRRALGPWAVSGPALAVGEAALSDAAWAERTRQQLTAMADALDKVLERAGFAVRGGTPLFRLAAHAEAAAVYDRLGRAGILVRAFADRPNLLRFGLPADDEGLERLASALS